MPCWCTRIPSSARWASPACTNPQPAICPTAWWTIPLRISRRGSMLSQPVWPRGIVRRLQESLADTPVVLLNGPRQSGKTTLVRQRAAPLPHARRRHHGHRGPTGSPGLPPPPRWRRDRRGAAAARTVAGDQAGGRRAAPPRWARPWRRGCSPAATPRRCIAAVNAAVRRGRAARWQDGDALNHPAGAALPAAVRTGSLRY